MTHTAARHSLQNPRYWLRGERFETMDARHLSNCLRLVVKHPLRQLQASWDAHLRDACSAPDNVSVDDRLPDGGEDIYEGYIARRKWDEAYAWAQGEDVAEVWFRDHSRAVEHLAGNQEPESLERLRERAGDWIRRQPTYLAMREVLLDKILSGEADVVNRAILEEDFG